MWKGTLTFVQDNERFGDFAYWLDLLEVFYWNTIHAIFSLLVSLNHIFDNHVHKNSSGIMK